MLAVSNQIQTYIYFFLPFLFIYITYRQFLSSECLFFSISCVPRWNPPFIYTPPHALLPSFSVPTYFTLICTSFRGANRFWQHFWETSPLSWPRPSCLKVLLNGSVVSFENACWIQLIKKMKPLRWLQSPFLSETGRLSGSFFVESCSRVPLAERSF